MKSALLGFGCILMSTILLTACNTVEGTAEGMGKDATAVKNAISPSPQQKHKKMMKKSSNAVSEKNTDETNDTY